jgi:CHAD domain-containing protein
VYLCSSVAKFFMKGKRISGLDCAAPAEQMIQHVLRAQVKAMCALRKKALDGSDPEGVHDMRVWSRHLRSAISDFEPHRRKSALPIPKLRVIARSLGAVRDEDVAIAALEKLASEARGKAAEGIELLAEERRQRRNEARAALKKAISPSAVKGLRDEFERKLQSVTKPSRKSIAPEPADAPPTFGSIGPQIINARLKELRKNSPHIYSPFQVKELHELRILAKGLRYAVDTFAVCAPDEMTAMAKEIAQLQTSLGELHDCDVWIEDLGARLKKLGRQNESDRETTLLRTGCTWLLKHFARVRTDHYRDALGRWQQWEEDGFLDRLRTIIPN